MRYLLTFLLLFILSIARSQESVLKNKIELYEINGLVLTALGQPVSSATIVFTAIDTQKKLGSITDTKGQFFIELKHGAYEVEISALGYALLTTKVTVTQSENLPSFVLIESVEQLDEVLIHAALSKGITHNANGLTVVVRNDSLFKKLSLEELLPYLPGVRMEADGVFKYQGEQATVLINGRFQKMSRQQLDALLKNERGDRVHSIELIDSPSAKYSGSIQKIININLLKRSDYGIAGSVSTRLSNVDLLVSPSANLNYTTGKFVFSVSGTPLKYQKTSTQNFTTRTLLDQNFTQKEVQNTMNKTNNNGFSVGVDYTLNDRHSAYLSLGANSANDESQYDFNSEQFAMSTLEKVFSNSIKSDKQTGSQIFNFGYRYDMNASGARMDLANSYKINKLDRTRLLDKVERNLIDNSEITELNRDVQEQDNKQFSGRIDFTFPRDDIKQKFEAGIGYDAVSIDDVNGFDDFNAMSGEFASMNEFSNAFGYKEENATGYVDLSNNRNRLKYAIGLRLEYSKTKSSSQAIPQIVRHRYTNLLPVLSFKYMVNKAQTSTVNLAYRKGYVLPPYIQLNSFETQLNSTTISRGNPNLNQSVYNRFNLGYTHKNTYFFTLSTTFQKNYFAPVQYIENKLNIRSYQNLGNKNSYRFNLSTNYKILPIWRLYLEAKYDHITMSTNRLNLNTNNYFLSFTNSVSLPNEMRFSLITSINNGNNSTFETQNNFLRFFSTATLSTQFFKKKFSVNLRVVDIFGINNKNKNDYLIDNILYTTREIRQSPHFFIDLSYRFQTGKRIAKKDKKTSTINGDRF